MTITISNTLSQTEYENLRFALITQLEGGESTPYFDKNGYVTIGYGFNIDTGNTQLRDQVLLQLGISPGTDEYDNFNNLWGSQALSEVRDMPATTEEEKTAKNQALTNLFAQTIGQSFSLTDPQMLIIFNGIVETKDNEAQSYTGVTAYSAERAVLTSLHYNSLYQPPNADALLGPSLLNSLTDTADAAEARAEAWYQIRYVSGDQYKRRIIESELFGLYADFNNVTADEAKAVYRVYTTHKDDRMNTDWDK